MAIGLVGHQRSTTPMDRVTNKLRAGMGNLNITGSSLIGPNIGGGSLIGQHSQLDEEAELRYNDAVPHPAQWGE